MGEILGLGVTHFPGLMLPDAYMSSFLTRTLNSERIPAELKDPKSWPEPLQRELAANENGAAAAAHRKRLVEGFRRVREELDAFAPDFVLIWGDDQYENFREDVVPPFNVYILRRDRLPAVRQRRAVPNSATGGERQPIPSSAEGTSGRPAR